MPITKPFSHILNCLHNSQPSRHTSALARILKIPNDPSPVFGHLSTDPSQTFGQLCLGLTKIKFHIKVHQPRPRGNREKPPPLCAATSNRFSPHVQSPRCSPIYSIAYSSGDPRAAPRPKPGFLKIPNDPNPISGHFAPRLWRRFPARPLHLGAPDSDRIKQGSERRRGKQAPGAASSGCVHAEGGAILGNLVRVPPAPCRQECATLQQRSHSLCIGRTAAPAVSQAEESRTHPGLPVRFVRLNATGIPIAGTAARSTSIRRGRPFSGIPCQPCHLFSSRPSSHCLGERQTWGRTSPT
jgi:hypothetical protein